MHLIIFFAFYFCIGALFSRGLYLYRKAKGRKDLGELHFPIGLLWVFVVIGLVIFYIALLIERICTHKAVVSAAKRVLGVVDATFTWLLRLKPTEK